MKGKLGNIKINTSIHDPRKTAKQQEAFDRLRAAHYEKVDWALVTRFVLRSFVAGNVPDMVLVAPTGRGQVREAGARKLRGAAASGSRLAYLMTRRFSRLRAHARSCARTRDRDRLSDDCFA